MQVHEVFLYIEAENVVSFDAFIPAIEEYGFRFRVIAHEYLKPSHILRPDTVGVFYLDGQL